MTLIIAFIGKKNWLVHVEGEIWYFYSYAYKRYAASLTFISNCSHLSLVSCHDSSPAIFTNSFLRMLVAFHFSAAIFISLKDKVLSFTLVRISRTTWLGIPRMHLNLEPTRFGDCGTPLINFVVCFTLFTCPFRSFLSNNLNISSSTLKDSVPKLLSKNTNSRESYKICIRQH